MYKIGKGSEENNATTEFDLTEKSITPVGSFVHYGDVREDYMLLKVLSPEPQPSPSPSPSALALTTCMQRAGPCGPHPHGLLPRH